jgi:hypothetical protein
MAPQAEQLAGGEERRATFVIAVPDAGMLDIRATVRSATRDRTTADNTFARTVAKASCSASRAGRAKAKQCGPARVLGKRSYTTVQPNASGSPQISLAPTWR